MSRLTKLGQAFGAAIAVIIAAVIATSAYVVIRVLLRLVPVA